MGDFFQTLRSLLRLEDTPDQKRLRESLERPAKQGVPPLLRRPQQSPGFLGETPRPRGSYQAGSALMPPSLPKIQNPMEVMGRRMLNENIEKMKQPGAKVLDFIPAEPLTPEEEKALQDAYERAGRTYRPATRAKGDLPKDTLVVGPLNRRRRGK